MIASPTLSQGLDPPLQIHLVGSKGLKRVELTAVYMLVNAGGPHNTVLVKKVQAPFRIIILLRRQCQRFKIGR